MNILTEKVFEYVPLGDFTAQDVATLFPDSDNRRYSLVKRAIANGEIIHICRGLYCLAPKYRKKKINLYALAQHIYGPSYVSLESALSWHGWIPEAVYTLTSVSLGKAKTFNTPLGVFSYVPVPQKILYTAVKRMRDEEGNVFLMATPIKALADYVYVNRKNWTGLKQVTESLRVESEEFESITADDIELVINNYTNQRIKRFIEGLKKDLKL